MITVLPTFGRLWRVSTFSLAHEVRVEVPYSHQKKGRLSGWREWRSITADIMVIAPA